MAKKEIGNKLNTKELFFNYTNEMACIAGFDGYFKELNPAWSRVLGWSTEELLSKPWNDFVHPDDVEATESIKSTIVDGKEVYTFENRYICKDGTVKWLSWNSRPYPEEGIMFGVARDITEQKEKDIELKKQHEMLVKLTDQMPGVVYQFQLFPDGSMHFPFSSPGMLEIFGYTPEEIKENGKLAFERVHPDDIERVYNETFQSAKNLTHFYCEFRIILPDKGVEWRLCDAAPERMEDGSTLWYGMIIDITQQKKSEALLLRSKNRTRSFLDVSRKMVVADYNENIMQMIVDNAIKATGLDTGAIYLLKDDQNSIILKATVPPLSDDFPYELRIAKLNDHPHIKKVFSTGKLVVMPDAQHAKLTKSEKKAVESRNLRSNLYLPINIGKQVIGVLIISSTTEPYIFDEEELYLLQGFADQAAHIINNQFNYEKLENYAKELESEIDNRLRAEEALKLSEQGYRLLFENNPHPMWVYDVETLNYIEVNEAAIQKYGYSREEFLEMNIKDIRPSEEEKRLLDNIQHDKNGNELSFSGEWIHQRKNGELFWVEVISHKLNYKNHQAKLVLVNDITERRKAENELIRSERLLNEAQKIAKLGSWNFDFRNDVLTWSDGLYNVFDVDRDTFKDTHGSFLSLIDEEDRDRVLETRKLTQETGKPFHIIYSITTPKGERRQIEEYGFAEKDNTGRIVRLFGTAQNVTERMQIQEKLLNSDRIFRYASDMLCIVGFDGYFKVVNPAWTNVLGWSEEELLSKPYKDFLHPDDLELSDTEKEKVHSGTGSQNFENRYICKDGSYKWLSWNSYPYHDEEKIYAVVRDVTKQKEIERGLRRLSTAVEQSPASIVITDLDGTIEYVNPAFTDLTGYALNEAKGNNPRILNSGRQSKEIYKELWETITSGKIWRGELHNKKKNGELFWERAIISPVFDKKGKIINYLAIKEDITEKKIIEEKLIESEKRFREIFETLPVISVQGYDRNRNAIYWNKASEIVYGYSSEEAIGQKIEDLIIPDEMKEQVKKNIEMWLENNEPIPSSELKLRNKQGGEVYVYSNHVMLENLDGKKELFCIDVDLTDLRKTQQELRESEEYHRSLIQTIPDLIFVLERDGKIIDYKTSDESKLFSNPKDFMNKNIAEIMPPEVANMQLEAIEKSFEEQNIIDYEYSLNLNGKIHYFNAKTVTFGDDKVIVTSRDITDYQKNLDKIRELLEEQEKQNQNLRDFTYIVSHNLRIHTANLLGILIALEAEDKEHYENVFIQMIQESSERLESTIRHLIEVLNIKLEKNLELEPVLLNNLVQRVINDLSEKAENFDVQVKNDISKEITIRTVPDYIEKIITNLLLNGIQFSSEKRESWVRIYAEKESSYIKISVQDNGVGIDLNKHKEKLFGMYVKFHNDENSQGFGLFQVKNQVEALDGKIEVESELDKGSTFTIYLPYE